MNLPVITKEEVKGKKVLVRVDFNLPLNGGKVKNSERIKNSEPTVRWLLDNGAIVFLISHFGDPGGKKSNKYSLKKVIKTASKVFGEKIIFVPDCVGSARDKAVANSNKGNLYLFENTRFHSGDKENDPEYAKELSKEMDLYVYDAFSEGHRAHASTVGITKYLPTYAGLGFVSEIEGLDKYLKNPKTPFVAVSGGAKISTKIEVLKGLIAKVDVLILGGGMANTMLVAEGYDIGKSLYEEEYVDAAEEIASLAYDNAVELLLPDDVVVAKKPGPRAKTQIKAIDEVNKGEMIVDIGPKSIAKFSEPLKFAGTIFWNGPMGIAEYKPSAQGTEGVAKIISESEATSVIGGGDTVASVGSDIKFDFVSSGGGATLSYIAGEKLPTLTMFEKR